MTNKEILDKNESQRRPVERHIRVMKYFSLSSRFNKLKRYKVRSVRNQYLEQTDKYMITDYPITEEERELYKQYREYLRTYPECQDWYKANPKTYDEWKFLQTTNNNDVSLE